MKRMREALRLLLTIGLACLMVGCGEDKDGANASPTLSAALTETQTTKPVESTPSEEAVTPLPTDTPTPTLTPTPRPAHGVTVMSLYKNYKDKKERSRYGETYESKWTKGEDITSFECIAADVQTIATNGRYFQDLWRTEWEKFDNCWDCKIAYRVQFSTADGVVVDQLLRNPGEELWYHDYIENYLYDDIHQEKGKWYYHMLEEDINDDMILSSIKFTAGQKISQVYSPIKVTAYVYSSEEDFDAAGNYLGSLSYSVSIVNTAADAITAPEPTEAVTGEPVQTEPNTAELTPAVITPVVTTAVSNGGSNSGSSAFDNTEVPAEKVDISITNSNGKGASDLKDSAYKTRVVYAAGDTVTITSETEFSGIYLIWGSKVSSYTVTANGVTTQHGELGILHDFIELSGPTKEVTVTVSSDTSLCDIYAYTAGKLPEDVQRWEAPYDRADMLIFSTHADDEVLFFGGAAIVYGGVENYRVQLVYMCNYWDGERIREHEKLDGLWTMGLRAYPVNMPFGDYYSESLAGAKKKYDYDKLVEAVTEQIRRFKPQTIVTHDINGEYGHGGHMILYAATAEAVDNSMNEAFYPDSVARYGTWDVPKTYIHLWAENKLRLNLREPLDAFGGKTAIEVAELAYKKHVSQQWCWFYVSDEYEYSCADYGLYRTTVGTDTGNDMMENIVSYDEQDRIAREEAERIAKLTEAAQLTQAAQLTEAAQIAAANAALTEAVQKAQAEEQAKADAAKEKSEQMKNAIWKCVGIVLCVITAVVVVFAILIVRKRIRKKKRKLARMRKMAEARRKAAERQGAAERDGDQ